MHSKVLVLYAGGTFGMKEGPTGLVPMAAKELVELLGDFGAEEGVAWDLELLRDHNGRPVPPIDSSEVTPRHWLWMAAMLEKHYDGYDGFVIVHGTDTLAYTASALSFLLVNLAKPVVVTGSQLPIGHLRSDARLNFLNALMVAGYRASGLPLVPEVVVCFGEHVLRGNRSRKASTFGWQGFASPNYPPLGSLGETIRIHPELVRPVPDAGSSFYVERALVEDVLDLTLFPGIRPAQVDALVSRPELRGLVLRAYGSGNAPADPELLSVLKRATKAGKPILLVTQCHEGKVDLGRYASSHPLIDSGVASGFDLTPEAALTKLMWLLAQEDGAEVRIQLQLNQRGEQSYNQYELDFPLNSPTGKLVARPPGSFRKSHLERAVLRVAGFKSDSEVQVYLNTEQSVLATLKPPGGKASSGAGVQQVVDVTAGVRRVMVDDRPFHLILKGSDFSFRSIRLVLVTQA